MSIASLAGAVQLGTIELNSSTNGKCGYYGHVDRLRAAVFALRASIAGEFGG